jgi:hypothetical protein
LYAEKSALLWKAAELQELLRSCATRAADMAEAGRIRHAAGDDTGGGTGAQGVQLGVEEWAAVRREVFPDDRGANEFGHIRVADFGDHVNALPRCVPRSPTRPSTGRRSFPRLADQD